MGSGSGYGEPLGREIDPVKEDVKDDVYLADIVKSVYGVVGILDKESHTSTIDEEATETRSDRSYVDRF